MQIEILKSTKEALNKYSQSLVLDFEGINLYERQNQYFDKGIFIGPEGGFDEEERRLFEKQIKLSIPNSIILKSECAAILISALATI